MNCEFKTVSWKDVPKKIHNCIGGCWLLARLSRNVYLLRGPMLDCLVGLLSTGIPLNQEKQPSTRSEKNRWHLMCVWVKDRVLYAIPSIQMSFYDLFMWIFLNRRVYFICQYRFTTFHWTVRFIFNTKTFFAQFSGYWTRKVTGFMKSLHFLEKCKVSIVSSRLFVEFHNSYPAFHVSSFFILLFEYHA